MAFCEKEHDFLLDQWEVENRNAGVSGFHRDGIIDLSKWSRAPLKVMFVLKETNGESENIDVRQRIRDASQRKTGWRKGQVLRRVGRWAFGLLNYEEEKIPEYPTNDSDIYTAPLSVSYINLLKRNGGNVTGAKRLDAAVMRCQSLIRQQINLIAPDIVVLCGTYGPMKKHVFPSMVKKSHRVHQDDQRIYINAFHPASRRMSSRAIYAQVLESYDCFRKTPVSRHR